MGQTLSKPVIDRLNEEGGCDGAKYAVSSIQGWRTAMEDSHACQLSLISEHTDWYYFGVFDGHSGGSTSKKCASDLHIKIISIYTKYMNDIKNNGMKNSDGFDPSLPVEVAVLVKSTTEGYLEFDDELREIPTGSNEEFGSGTTATSVFVLPTHIIFVNCGDSRGALCRNGELAFQTKDHKPNLPDEKSRIEKAGGTVVMDRVNGNLAVSRALGDFSFKSCQNVPKTEQPVSPEPTITVLPRDEKDQFIILACDGVWDVMSTEQVISFIHTRLQLTANYVDIVNDLIDACLYLNSRDNMTALLVVLPSSPKVDPVLVENEKEIEKLLQESIKTIIDHEVKMLGALAVINKLCKEYENNTLIGENGIYYRARFVINVLNEIDSNRDKSQDYALSGSGSESALAMQIFKGHIPLSRDNKP